MAMAIACGAVPLAHGGEVDDLRAQLAAMQQQMDALKAHLEQVSAQVQQQAASPPPVAATSPAGIWQPSAWARQILDESQFYGNLDVSFDDTTKGLKSFKF
jgi:multidrug resistance efflux pump